MSAYKTSSSFWTCKHRSLPGVDGGASCVDVQCGGQFCFAFIPGNLQPTSLVPLKDGFLELGNCTARAFINTAVYPDSTRRPTPTPVLVQVSPRTALVAQGAALAYLVAVGGGGGGGGETPSSSEGCEALVEAGMLAVLMRTAATKSSSSLEQAGEPRAWVACAPLCRREREQKPCGGNPCSNFPTGADVPL